MNVHTKAPIALAILALAVIIGCKAAEPPPPQSSESPTSPLEGAWSVVSTTGSDAATNTTVLPSVYLFGDKYYSMMRVTGPRTLAAKDSATNAEKLAAYDSFVANSGTYEVAGSTLTIHPVVARSPNYMSGGSDKYQFKVSGDTLWLENTGADFRTMIGGQLVNPAGRPSTTTQVLVRQK